MARKKKKVSALTSRKRKKVSALTLTKRKARKRFAQAVKKRPKLKRKVDTPKVKARPIPKGRKPKGWKKLQTPRAKGVESMLERARETISQDYGIDGDIRKSVNADFSIDWELRFAIKRGTRVNDLRIDLANLLRPVNNTWIASGIRFRRDSRMTDVQEAQYERYHGMKQVHAHFQRNTDRKIFSNMEGLDKILRGMKRNRRLKPEQLFVRIHWNLKGERPQ